LIGFPFLVFGSTTEACMEGFLGGLRKREDTAESEIEDLTLFASFSLYHKNQLVCDVG
jgi:hypothetical protein